MRKSVRSHLVGTFNCNVIAWLIEPMKILNARKFVMRTLGDNKLKTTIALRKRRPNEYSHACTHIRAMSSVNLSQNNKMSFAVVTKQIFERMCWPLRARLVSFQFFCSLQYSIHTIFASLGLCWTLLLASRSTVVFIWNDKKNIQFITVYKRSEKATHKSIHSHANANSHRYTVLYTHRNYYQTHARSLVNKT